MMRMFFGDVAIVATEAGANSYELTAFTTDSVENLEPITGVRSRTVNLSELFEAASEMAELARLHSRRSPF